jgi:ribosome-binding factor A
MKRNDSTQHPGVSQRQLRVGEEIRHALADLFIRGEFDTAEISLNTLTVTEVRVSPDLQNATVFVIPLGGKNQEAIMQWLRHVAVPARVVLSKKIILRSVPRLHFRLDESFDEASRMEALFRDPKVAQDIRPKKPSEE